MDVDLDNSSENSICEEETCEVPLEGAGAGGFLNLNDDCLLHLFRYLPLVDLGSIKDTCNRLSQLADQSFKLRKDKSITIQNDSMLADIWNLTHFGKLMNSLTVRSIYKEFASCNEIFQMIAKYSNEQLKEFTVDLRSVADGSLPYLEEVLKNVETIKLLWVDNGGQIDLLLGYCENLRDVYIEEGYIIRPRLGVKPLWCSKHANITSLTLMTEMQTDKILVEICEKLAHLECFEFYSCYFTSNNISRLSQLDHLKRFKIRSIESRIGNDLQKFAEKNHLEYLCLSDVTICEALAHTLGDFQNLKELVFHYPNFGENAKNVLSKTLANVEKLAFVESAKGREFENVTHIVENLLNLKELSVTGPYYGEDFLSRNNYLRLRKKRNLEIFLKDSDYKKSIESIGNDVSEYVRITARPKDFFNKLCSVREMN